MASEKDRPETGFDLDVGAPTDEVITPDEGDTSDRETGAPDGETETDPQDTDAPVAKSTEEKLRLAEDRAKRERREKKKRDDIINAQNRQIAELTGLVTEIAKRVPAIEHRQQQTDGAVIATAKERVLTQLQQARRAQATAIASADEAAIMEAEEAVFTARSALQQINAAEQQIQRQPQQRQQPREQQQRQPAQPQANPLADQWKRSNAWFEMDASGRPANRDSAVAAAISQRLLEEGYQPHEEEHFEELTAELRKVLPHRFARAAQAGQTQQRRTPGNVVAAVTRTGAPGKDDIPAAVLDVYRAAGRDVNDPKVRDRAKKYWQEQQARRPGGAQR